LIGCRYKALLAVVKTYREIEMKPGVAAQDLSDLLAVFGFVGLKRARKDRLATLA
jgi:hypothetical protein